MSRAVELHVGRVEGAQLRRVLRPAERRERPQARTRTRCRARPGRAPSPRPRAARRPRRSPRRGTRPAAGGPTRAGARCTRAGCSRASSGRRPSRASRGGSATRPSRTASIAGLASSVHVAEPLERDQRLDAPARAVRVRHVVHVRAASRRSAPPRAARPPPPRAPRRPPSRGSAPGAASVMRPSSPITVISSSPCLRPISKSFGSWPGVILSAPVPNSGSTYSSAMIGSRRPTSGRIARLADQPRVALVGRVHRDRGVGQHRLGPHRRHRDRARAGLERVVDQVERVLDRALLDLEVRDRRAQARVPVDHVVVAVDEPLLVQVHEHVRDRAHVVVVHREALVLVVERGARARLNCSVIVEPCSLAPLPHALDERARGRAPPWSSALLGSSACSTWRCVAMPAWSVP